MSSKSSMQAFMPNMSMFMRPERAPPSAWTGHIPFAAWLMEAAKPGLVVELGTHYGASFLAMCQAIEGNGLNCKACAVDTWEGDVHAGGYGENVFSELSEYHSRKYAGFSRLMRMTFDEALGYFDDGSVDLLHIDGLHTYEAVKHDFESWLPKLSRNGVVMFHDTCVREREFGVWRFWEECKSQHPSFEFFHSHGLGILAVGVDVADPVKQLVAIDNDEERALINTLFARLGETLTTSGEIERLSATVAHERALRKETLDLGVERSLAAHQDTLRLDLAHIKEATLSACQSTSKELSATFADLLGQNDEREESRIAAVKDLLSGSMANLISTIELSLREQGEGIALVTRMLDEANQSRLSSRIVKFLGLTKRRDVV